MAAKKKQYERPVIQRLNTGLMGKFGTKADVAPVTHIDELPVNELVQQYGSPLFVLSERSIRQTYRDASRAFKTRYPKVQFAWSYKTNYINAVCHVFHQEGSWAEVVSGFEYDKAISNGVPGAKIIFNGPGKSAAELSTAIANGSLIHIDHIDEFYIISSLAMKSDRRPQVAIRVNMDTGVYPMWDRFGFNYENGEAWDAIGRIVQDNNMDLKGLHCHIGTFMLTPGAYGVAAAKLSELAFRIKKNFSITVSYLDLGGGFASRNTLKGSYLQGADAAPDFDQYAEAITTALLNSGFREEELPLLILETGRALIDEAGYLLGSVVSNKRLTDGRRATILDFGVNILFTSFWFDHKISPAEQVGQSQEHTVLYGPLCMNIDVIRENLFFPLLKKDDRVVVHCVGAYNMTQWMQFITLRPAVVMTGSDGKAHLVRERETRQSVEGAERLPGYLKPFDL